MFCFQKLAKSILIINLLFITACTWVTLMPEAESVQVSTAGGIVDCQKKGQASVSLKDSVIGIKRGTKQVKKELTILGKNSALNIGGNAIVPASEIKDGKQTFDVYTCQ